MSIDPHAYNISVRRGRFDDEVLFEARVRELPDLVEYAETYEDAYDLALDSIVTAAEAFAEQRRSFPEASVPFDDFSGRITLRLPRSLHRALAETADREAVSLNQYLVNVLSYFAGFAAGHQGDTSSPWQPIGNPASLGKAPKRNLRLVRCDPIERQAS